MNRRRQASKAARPPIPAQPRRRACGKRYFDDRIAADFSLATIRAKGAALQKDPVRSYACPRCHGWHLTSVRDERVRTFWK
ncbi:hypothetical protein Kisp01_67410 [Kineosporia sp. NBRC 101677]|uniref:hypothetical protein n=1 Tax=Kineosporia sp. NBRC 101677 TaxID=3032197 RepID=UPI0024A15DE2|nr:hypothetical protein [Kineosporia sp. NBRC 101677]GLY19727.1 hypothetical protein Kisp01_67410 [Kineosporia sp. NBRC 101677]